MTFDRYRDHGFAQSVSGLILLTTGFRGKAGGFADSDFRNLKNPSFPLLPSVQILFQPSVYRRLSEDFWVGVRKG
jgi:hypothetical protein